MGCECKDFSSKLLEIVLKPLNIQFIFYLTVQKKSPKYKNNKKKN